MLLPLEPSINFINVFLYIELYTLYIHTACSSYLTYGPLVAFGLPLYYNTLTREPAICYS